MICDGKDSLPVRDWFLYLAYRFSTVLRPGRTAYDLAVWFGFRRRGVGDRHRRLACTQRRDMGDHSCRRRRHSGSDPGGAIIPEAGCIIR